MTIKFNKQHTPRNAIEGQENLKPLSKASDTAEPKNSDPSVAPVNSLHEGEVRQVYTWRSIGNIKRRAKQAGKKVARTLEFDPYTNTSSTVCRARRRGKCENREAGPSPLEISNFRKELNSLLDKDKIARLPEEGQQIDYGKCIRKLTRLVLIRNMCSNGMFNHKDYKNISLDIVDGRIRAFVKLAGDRPVKQDVSSRLRRKHGWLWAKMMFGMLEASVGIIGSAITGGVAAPVAIHGFGVYFSGLAKPMLEFYNSSFDGIVASLGNPDEVSKAVECGDYNSGNIKALLERFRHYDDRSDLKLIAAFELSKIPGLDDDAKADLISLYFGARKSAVASDSTEKFLENILGFSINDIENKGLTNEKCILLSKVLKSLKDDGNIRDQILRSLDVLALDNPFTDLETLAKANILLAFQIEENQTYKDQDQADFLRSSLKHIDNMDVPAQIRVRKLLAGKLTEIEKGFQLNDGSVENAVSLHIKVVETDMNDTESWKYLEDHTSGDLIINRKKISRQEVIDRASKNQS